MCTMSHHASMHRQPDSEVLWGQWRCVLWCRDLFHRKKLHTVSTMYQWNLFQQRVNERV